LSDASEKSVGQRTFESCITMMKLWIIPISAKKEGWQQDEEFTFFFDKP
jgi:hypothetical protein